MPDSLLRYTIVQVSESVYIPWALNAGPASIGCNDEQADLFLFRRPTPETHLTRERVWKKLR